MGAWTEIVDFTFTANETSRAFTGLNITKDDFIKVVANIKNATGSINIIKIFPNNNTTTTNYHVQRLTGDGSSVSAARDNDAKLNFIPGSQTATAFAFIKLSQNDRYNQFTNAYVRDDSSLNTSFEYVTSSGATFTSITSLTFSGTQTNGIGIGSRIQIYRLDAEKVADITTTANATQVDISSLSIGKDSEYLLVSDVKQGAIGTSLNLTVNDATTLTNYNVQRIRGNGSTADAERQNSARYTNNDNSLSYTHIKLSEIGAYTSQSYQLQGTGSTSLRLLNNFVSSTAENITSITKLNVIANNTNGIGSGSRFELYKLK